MSDSDSDQVASVNPQPKRRRIIFAPSSIISVPIYSNKVNKCLQLNPTPAVLTQNDIAYDHAEAAQFRDSARLEDQKNNLSFTDSEDEEEQKPRLQTQISDSVVLCSPSPPKTPSRAPVNMSTGVMDEVKGPLDSLSPVLSLPLDGAVGKRTRAWRSKLPPVGGPLLTDTQNCDDVVVYIPETRSPPAEPEDPLVGREIQLKFRCRTEIHRVPVVSSRPLAEAVEVLAIKLKVPSSRLLLLRNEMELSTQCSAIQLGLSIADIIDCVVIVEEEQETQSRDMITVRLQGKDRGSTREYSLHKDAALGSILSQYTASRSTRGRAKLRFLFDGSKIKAGQTPAQLDMEDGDVIEVWT